MKDGAINVLEKVNEWRSHHGVLVKDYTGYRKYCTGKIAALRKALPLAWIQKSATRKKKKGTKRKGKYRARTALPPDAEYKPKYLMLYLLLAERSWSVASAVELALLRGKRLSGAPVRKYIIRHFGMAVRWLNIFWATFGTALKADKLSALSFELYRAEATARWLSLRNRHIDALRKATEGLAFASAMRSLQTHSEAEVTKKTASLYDVKRVSERNAKRAGVDSAVIEGAVSGGTDDGLSGLRLLGCSAENKAAGEIDAASLTPFKIVLGADTTLLDLKSEALLMRVSGVVKRLGETTERETDTTGCVNEIQETMNELQDALFSLPSNERAGDDRKEIEGTIQWLRLSSVCLSLTNKINLLTSSLQSLKSAWMNSLASHVPFYSLYRQSEGGQAFVDAVLLHKVKPEVPIKLATAALEAIDSDVTALKPLLKLNVIPQDIIDALKNTKAVFLSILCLLNFQFEQAFVLTKLASERTIEELETPKITGGGVLGAPILELYDAGRKLLCLLTPVTWKLQSLTIGVLLSNEITDVTAGKKRLAGIISPLPHKPRKIYPGPKLFDLVEEVDDLQILQSPEMYIRKKSKESTDENPEEASVSQNAGLLNRLLFWR